MDASLFLPREDSMKANHGMLVAAAALLLAACAPSAMSGGGNPKAEYTPATVSVENQNWSDVTVYLVQGSSRIRLGMVTSMGSASFRVPRGMEAYAGQLRLLADPVGSSHMFLSEAVQIRPGQRVALQLGNNLNVSFVSVWN
jgi:hypothetical protein